YFTDEFQCMPLHGYTRMFENMLDHPNITVATGVEYQDVRDSVKYGHTIYCGPIDEFFDYRYGRLPYRSLRFDHVTLEQERFQPVGVVNYPSQSVPYTRITEYKHLTGQQHAKTSLTYEIPSAEGDPYYPVPRPENNALFHQYQVLADRTRDVSFVGRLATYRYYNMDQVVAQALTLYARLSQQPAPARAAAVSKLPAAQGA
nr:UDP-galactopyranose mutase [Pseudomonas sp.]